MNMIITDVVQSKIVNQKSSLGIFRGGSRATALHLPLFDVLVLALGS